MFGRKAKRIRKLEHDVDFWKNMDSYNERIFDAYNRDIKAKTYKIEELEKELKDKNTIIEHLSTSQKYWMNNAIEARENNKRLEEEIDSKNATIKLRDLTIEQITSRLRYTIEERDNFIREKDKRIETLERDYALRAIDITSKNKTIHNLTNTIEHLKRELRNAWKSNRSLEKRFEIVPTTVYDVVDLSAIETTP